MPKIDAKVRSWGTRWRFHCPGCGHAHVVHSHADGKPLWDLSGTIDNPTIHPSIKVTGADDKGDETICHSFVRNGRIEFLTDCTHDLKGQTVELPEVEPIA